MLIVATYMVVYMYTVCGEGYTIAQYMYMYMYV